MLDELPHLDNKQARSLRDEERALLMALLSSHQNFHHYENEIANAKVYDMADGRMGSIEFIASREQRLGMTLVKAEYIDVDGVSVSICINADNQGHLFELDIWKTDFSPLKQYPSPKLVKIIE